MISEQKKCLENQKNIFMVTLPIKHEKLDSLSSQLKQLRRSIAKFKNSRKWRGIRDETLATVYETTFGQENGYHHHCHMIISTNSTVTKTKVKEAFIPYWRKETGTYLNIIQLNEPTTYYSDVNLYLRYIFLSIFLLFLQIHIFQ